MTVTITSCCCADQIPARPPRHDQHVQDVRHRQALYWLHAPKCGRRHLPGHGYSVNGWYQGVSSKNHILCSLFSIFRVSGSISVCLVPAKWWGWRPQRTSTPPWRTSRISAPPGWDSMPAWSWWTSPGWGGWRAAASLGQFGEELLNTTNQTNIVRLLDVWKKAKETNQNVMYCNSWVFGRHKDDLQLADQDILNAIFGSSPWWYFPNCDCVLWLSWPGTCTSSPAPGTTSSGSAGWTSGVRSTTPGPGSARISVKVNLPSVLQSINRTYFRGRGKRRLSNSWKFLLILYHIWGDFQTNLPVLAGIQHRQR